METDPQSRVEEAVPTPDEARKLTEEEKRALELGAEIEHQVGGAKERTAEKAAELGGSPLP